MSGRKRKPQHIEAAESTLSRPAAVAPIEPERVEQKRHDRFEWTGLTFNIIVGIATVVATSVVAYQAMLMRESNQLAHQQAADAGRQAAEAQRPWVLLDTLDPKTSDPAPDGSRIISVLAKVTNTGSLPAFEVSGVVGWRLSEVPISPEPTFATTDGEESLGVMAPTKEFHQQVEVPIDRQQAELVRSGRLRLYVYGKLTYLDTLKKPHVTRWCESFSVTTKNFTLCSLGNVAD